MPATLPALPVRFIDWTSLHYQLIWAYEGGVAKHALAGTYSNTATSCWLVRKGQVTLRTAGKTVTARPGDWAFVASPIRHQTFSDDAEIVSLHFELSWPGGEALIRRDQNRVVPGARFPQLEKSARPIIRFVRKHFPHAGASIKFEPCALPLFFQLQAMLPGFLVAYLEAQQMLGNPPLIRGRFDDRILQGVTELDRLPLGQTLNRAGIAARLGLSPSHLDALFSTHLGMTPRRYIESRRLAEARQMLSLTGKSIKAIALELGFRHASHFCLWFKRLQGERPTLFRGKGTSGNRGMAATKDF